MDLMRDLFGPGDCPSRRYSTTKATGMNGAGGRDWNDRLGDGAIVEPQSSTTTPRRRVLRVDGAAARLVLVIVSATRVPLSRLSPGYYPTYYVPRAAQGSCPGFSSWTAHLRVRGYG
jgi:hypothetical protein